MPVPSCIGPWGLGLWAAPLAGVYTTAVWLRRTLYDKGWWRASLPPCPTVSVGGLEAGGSGKTPVAGLVLDALCQAGLKAGLLTRGYGRLTKKQVVRWTGDPADPATIGDEPAMLVQAGLDVPVAACGCRVQAAQALVSRGCNALVLDDGFTHRALGRHGDVVVLRGDRLRHPGHMLPWGTLREPPSSLRRAHVVWIHHRTQLHDLDRSMPLLAHACGAHALGVVSYAQPAPPVDHAGQPVGITNVRVVGAAGIAYPKDFQKSLQDAGATVMDFVAFPDHHRYRPADVHRLGQLQHKHRAAAVVVTPKDAVKLRPLWSQMGFGAGPGKPNLWIMGTQVCIQQGAEALAAYLTALTHRNVSLKSLVQPNPRTSFKYFKQ